ncbi:SRPBCC domain-containing protein [Dactylosporangium roseum]|uniref:SRPBCC domain-containing protein n=1 Tax=Dactylosporangium roseum TaxID=47989 RepID=A0ABY5Z1E1_9ACTN|nr:SRPBCC domain-containing protein [Dactylosporangium roseum]UWZ35828.1 SRPBCC domain-containing protein [Dactylosporangium roseum]
MTEIRVDVDLEHPPALVWRALTTARLVTDWLPTSRFLVRDNGTFTFRAERLEGLEDPVEGEIVVSDAPNRLVMRWAAENLHTVVALTIEELDSGSRLTMTQSGFLGPQGTMRRRVLLSTYNSLLEGPFKATLARVAAAGEHGEAGSTTVWRNQGGPFSRLSQQVNASSRSAPGLSSEAWSTAGPRPTATLPGFAAAVLGAQSKEVAKVTPSDSDEATAAAGPAQGPAGGLAASVRVASASAAARTARIGPLARGGAAVRSGWAWLARSRDWSADQRGQAVAAAAAVLLLIAMVALLVGKATTPHPANPPQVGGGADGPEQATVPGVPNAEKSPRSTSAPVVPATSSSVSPAAPSTGTVQPSTTPTPPQLTATYRSEALQLTSYRVTVTVANPGTVAAAEWTVVIMLPILDLSVRNVSGAVMTRTGLKLIFTPVDATRTVKPGGAVQLSFEVEGLGARNEPATCTIDGRPCAAVPK